MTSKTFYVTVNRCPRHPDFVTLSVEDSSGGGTRHFGGKCCVEMYGIEVAKWEITARSARGLAEHFTLIADEIERGGSE